MLSRQDGGPSTVSTPSQMVNATGERTVKPRSDAALTAPSLTRPQVNDQPSISVGVTPYASHGTQVVENVSPVTAIPPQLPATAPLAYLWSTAVSLHLDAARHPARQQPSHLE